jgi:hypothetical protein
MSVVTYGVDYSDHELTPSELDICPNYDIRFLMRYIGYPGNSKCISHYPGAYEKHVQAGRLVLLMVELGNNDPGGGYAAGVAMAKRALQDANSLGYPNHLPIFFCADGWLTTSPTTAMQYLDGAASVVGKARTGAYGFRDFIKAAKAGGHATWLWLCGAPPASSEVAQGWPHIYQYNGGTVHLGGMQCDLDWAYPGVLDAIEHGHSPASAAPPHPGQVPPWPLPPGNYFGLISGPNASHGGFLAADQAWVRDIQQALIRKGYVPGISDVHSPWATGKYTEPTRDAVLRFQKAKGRPQTGTVAEGDWAPLLAA